MNRYVLGAAGLVVVAALAGALLRHLDGDENRGDQGAPLQHDPPAEAASSSGLAIDPDDERLAVPAESSSPGPGPGPGPKASLQEQIEAAQRSVEHARARRSAAREELVGAETEMEQVERQVEEVERFVEDLEARGEDPTRHADEGLALLHPTFERYRQTADRIARAQRTIDAASAELTSAERTLSDLREQLSRE